MITTSLKPRAALSVLGLMLLCSLTLFMGVAHGATYKTPYETGRHNAGTPNSSIVIRNAQGAIIGYGDSAIKYILPVPTPGVSEATYLALGHALFEQSCASCHGVNADGNPASGVPGSFPNLVGESTASVDFWIISGRMPAANPHIVQAIRKQQRLNGRQAREIAAWIASLSTQPSFPYIPQDINIKGAYIADGASLFALNCAACHTITGDGDAIDFGSYAPSLRKIPATEVAEAIRTGPGAMPRFSGNLSDAQVRDIVAYVTKYIEHPRNPGGLGLGGLGPVAEGFIGLALGVGLLALAGFWIGERQ